MNLLDPSIFSRPYEKNAVTEGTLGANNTRSVEDDNRERDLEAIRNWLIKTGRPPEDYLFQLIIDKCQNDAEALKHFLQYSRTGKGRNHLISIPAVGQKHSSVNDIDKIRNWLISIGEPEEQHQLVLEKCRNDPEAMAYFMKHVNGEFK